MIKFFNLTHRRDPNRVELGVIAMKRYFTFLQASGLVPYHQMIWCHIQDTEVGERDRERGGDV